MDAVRLAALALLSVSVHAWLIARTEVAARDSIGFARSALQLETPPEPLSRLDVIRESQHPPGYPAAVLLVSKCVRPYFGGVTPESMRLSAQLTAGLASLLTVIPMFLLGKRLFGPWVGFLAAAMLQLLPTYAEISSDGLADSLFLLMALTSLYFGVWSLQSDRLSTYAACGVFGGLAYLVRPEGLLVPAVTGLILLARFRSTPVIRSGLALSAGVLIIASPYMLAIGGITNKPTGKGFLQEIQGEKSEPTWKQARGSGNVTFAAWWHEPTDAGKSRMIWAARQLGDETTKAMHYLPALWAVVGATLLSRRVRTDMGLALLLAVAAAHGMLLWVLATKIGYVSERHTLLIVAIGCLFAAAAVEPMGRWVASWALFRRDDTCFWQGSLVILFLALTIPAIAKERLHENRAGHRRAGEWLAIHIEPDGVIYDPFCWAEYYAGRAWERKPFPPPGATNPLYILLEPNNENTHSRLPMMAPARAMAASGSPVYHWPEGVPVDEADVVIYRTVPKGG